MENQQARLEQTILKNLVHNETFSRKVLPYIKGSYFTELDERTVFSEISDYFLKFNQPPTTEALLINLENNEDLSDSDIQEIDSILFKLRKGSRTHLAKAITLVESQLEKD